MKLRADVDANDRWSSSFPSPHLATDQVQRLELARPDRPISTTGVRGSFTRWQLKSPRTQAHLLRSSKRSHKMLGLQPYPSNKQQLAAVRSSAASCCGHQFPPHTRSYGKAAVRACWFLVSAHVSHVGYEADAELRLPAEICCQRPRPSTQGSNIVPQHYRGFQA